MGMMFKGEIANEFGEVIGRYWFEIPAGSYVLRLYGVNRYGYTAEGIRRWCLDNGAQWWESDSCAR